MIHLDHYLDRLVSVANQFEYVRKAIKGFIQHTEPNTLMPVPPAPTNLASLLSSQGVQEILASVEFSLGGFPAEYKQLENRLAQNQIILVVAVFEDQLKAIHREVLRQDPKLLNPDRLIKLGRLVAHTEQKVIEEEIESAVQVLDRQSVKEKAKSFAKLGLPWGSRVEAVENMTTLRNRILHEDIEVPVTGWELASAQIAAVILPLSLYLRAEELYPSGFDSGMAEDEVEETRAVVERTLKNRKTQESF